jgi:hypothetical protein
MNHNSFEVGSLLLGWATGTKSDQIKKNSYRFKEAAKKFVNFTKGIGVYSLSKTATDELLWAHYANSHQGFCLEFDIEQLLTYKLEAEEIFEVKYVCRPPTISMVGFMAIIRDNSQLLQKLIATKSLRWKYEKELRICVGEAGLREYDFRALKAIYFGVRCSHRLIRLAMRLLRGRGLSYYQMQLIENSYELKSIEIADEFLNAKPYRGHIAPVDDGIPFLDEKNMPFERELRVAIEMARREPYCERVRDADLSVLKGTLKNPVFYVTYDRSDGITRKFFYSLQEIQSDALYT